MLTDNISVCYQALLGDGGMEVYEGIAGHRTIENLTLKPDPERTTRVLTLGELNERIRSLFYRLEEEGPHPSPAFTETFENNLSSVVVPENGA